MAGEFREEITRNGDDWIFLGLEERVDQKLYYDTVARMQKANVDPEYVQGWVGGFMGNPKREEQRITEAYEAGYSAGESGDTEGFDSWRVGA